MTERFDNREIFIYFFNLLERFRYVVEKIKVIDFLLILPSIYSTPFEIIYINIWDPALIIFFDKFRFYIIFID